MKANSGLDFDNLPLVEAAVRVTFNSPRPLSYSLVNSMHEDLRKSFPSVGEPQQVEVAPGAGSTQVEIGPSHLPGAVYTGHTQGLSVHVQPQVIVVRWSKRPGLREPKYPRYPSLRDSLWRAVEALRNACGDDFPGIAVVNMSYVNFIPVREPATVVKKYFSDDAQLKLMDTARQVRKLEAAWRADEELDVRFAVEQASANLPDEIRQGYRLTTAAGVRLRESLDAKSGLDRVHDVLQEFFLKLISEDAKKEWKLRTH